MNRWTVYKYTFPNGKCYIGVTKKTLAARQRSVESGWIGYKNCKLLWDAIQEYGIENIQQEILFCGECQDEDAAAMEIKYIQEYKSNNPEYGYNIGHGGEGLVKKNISPERREEIRAQALRMVEGNRGKKASEETRKRQRLAKLGVKRGPMPEETKSKIGFANSLANISEEVRRHKSESKMQGVSAVNKVTGEELIFRSQSEAAEYFGVRGSAVSRWINGTRNPTNGYSFKNIYPLTTTE